MKKTFQAKLPERFLKLGYQGSNLEMTESESVAFFTLLYVTVQEDDPPWAKPQGGQLYYFMSSAVSSPSNCIL